MGPFQDPWPVERINHVAEEEEGGEREKKEEKEKPKSGRPRGSARCALDPLSSFLSARGHSASAHPV